MRSRFVKKICVFCVIICVICGFFSVPAAARERIVSLSPDMTAMICALGASDELVGITRFCRVPVDENSVPAESVPAKPEILGDLSNIDVERLLMLEPTLVVFSHNYLPNLKKILRSRNIKMLDLGNENLEKIWENLQTLGDAISRSREARVIAENWQKTRDEVRSRAAKNPFPQKPRVLILWGSPAQALCCGNASFLAPFIEFCGAENAAPAGTRSWFFISREQLFLTRAELILLVDSSDSAKIIPASDAILRAFPPNLPAVRSRKIFVIGENSGRLHPTPALIQTLLDFEQLLRDNF